MFTISKGYDGRFKHKSRLLHERSHLALEFPQSNNRILRTYVPMLENAQITEKGAANLNSYSLVGRAGELFSYGGAKSRRLNLTFNINLLHVMQTDATEGISEKFKRQFRLFFDNKEQNRKLFDLRREAETLAAQTLKMQRGMGEYVDAAGIARLDKIANDSISYKRTKLTKSSDQEFNSSGRDYAAVHRNYYSNLIRKATGQPDAPSFDFLNKLSSSLGIPSSEQVTKELNDSINLVYFWVNLIRGSVLNNSSNTLYGPPIVRLTHGPMYNNVPCLVENYGIKILDEAGYDVQTLTPKKIEITLSLVESRTGNFGAYDATTPNTGDNLTGWESIITNNDLDPQNGLIGQFSDDLQAEAAAAHKKDSEAISKAISYSNEPKIYRP
jgi:hypothetical protein